MGLYFLRTRVRGPSKIKARRGLKNNDEEKRGRKGANLKFIASITL